MKCVAKSGNEQNSAQTMPTGLHQRERGHKPQTFSARRQNNRNVVMRLCPQWAPGNGRHWNWIIECTFLSFRSKIRIQWITYGPGAGVMRFENIPNFIWRIPLWRIRLLSFFHTDLAHTQSVHPLRRAETGHNATTSKWIGYKQSHFVSSDRNRSENSLIGYNGKGCVNCDDQRRRCRQLTKFNYQITVERIQ